MTEFPTTTYTLTPVPAEVERLSRLRLVDLMFLADDYVRSLENDPAGTSFADSIERRQGLADTVAALRPLAVMEDVARGLTDDQLTRSIEIIDDLDEDESLVGVQAAALATLQGEQKRRELAAMDDAALRQELQRAEGDAFGGADTATVVTARRVIASIKAEIVRRARAEAAQ